MIRKSVVVLFFAVVTGAAGFVFAEEMHGMPGMHANSAPATTASQPAVSAGAVAHPATDLANTVCPVTGDKVGNSRLTEVYEGKIYHMCCSDCPAEFEKAPAKFAKVVAADPAKYGVK